MEPIEVREWRCPVCNRVYEDYQSAKECAERVITEPRYKVGDTVYVKVRYPNDVGKPFVKRVIEEVYHVITEASENTRKRANGHQTEYALDRPVKVGKDLHIGYKKSSWFVGDFHMYPAKESYLHLIGDSVDCYFDLPDDAVLREDMIEED